MSSFLILILLLTVAYIIYYGIVISQDIITAKKTGESTEETIDVSGMTDDKVKTVEVHETAGGFSIGNEETKICSPYPTFPTSPTLPSKSLATTLATTPVTTLATTVVTTPVTTVATTDLSAEEDEIMKARVLSSVQPFLSEHTPDDYGLMLEGTGAKCKMGQYKAEDGSVIIFNYITDEASNPPVPVDENENVIEDNSHKTVYDKI